ncbi:hypothetical protein PR048_029458 [Dryococelus australis]|uniref:Uncharacterized protein n=1 Tax=Dryococelus australis TaxID=614101 RepID=A0ABQ9GG92_9NEOP|nr:hypothetical protein PR048_029458 [Dryococelus australis]
MTEKRVHNLRAATFYKSMQQNVDDSVTLRFDLQQIQPLPKSPIQEAYYSRQLGFYGLCIVGILSGSQLTFYTASKVDDVHITSPIRGHNFLPVDRIFGRMEKLLRK